ncbi:RIP homotypic interaction motif-containing protein [Catellatospora sichuanensis]|uniref:RIP homotypic interaction motif-containing protein n=1 Tax=Catellatospora sichuanensis TaxID=1969805 RepID=UPI001182FD38|nr:RIP homotypic interaction motif-containing protein [Catellatospora sichuanensis]
MRTSRAVPVVTGIVVAALGVTFLFIGLEQADRLASVVGAVAGVTGLGFSIWTATRSTARPTAEPGSGAPGDPATSGGLTINARNMRGVQIGGYRPVQHNGAGLLEAISTLFRALTGRRR